MKIVPIWSSLLFAVLTAPVVRSITFGELDENNDFPANGALMIDFVELGSPEFGYGVSCSGVLIHPRLFLTAAHCIVGSSFLDDDGIPLPRPVLDEAEDRPDTVGTPGIWVSFDPSPTDFDALGEKCGTCLDIDRVIINPGLKNTNQYQGGDLAIVVLKELYEDAAPVGLAPEDFLDDLKKSRDLFDAEVINVGYGANFDADTFPPKWDVEYNDQRMISTSTIKSLNKDFLGLNMHPNNDNGGTCYADSGGAAYYEDDNGDLLVVGIVSWGDRNCISTTRSARVDVSPGYDFVHCMLGEAADAEEYDECA